MGRADGVATFDTALIRNRRSVIGAPLRSN